MIKKYGGQLVKKGVYWDTKSWQMLNLPDGEILPGDPSHLYLRLNLIETILFIMVISGLFVLFLPALGIVSVAIAVVIFVGSFLVQKVLCLIIRQICKAETWICDITHRYFCKQCGRDCDDNITMIVRAFIFSLFFLLGALFHKYFLGLL